jgi:hypothetical protein
MPQGLKPQFLSAMCGMAKGHALIQSQSLFPPNPTPEGMIEHDFVSESRMRFVDPTMPYRKSGGHPA